MSQGRNSRSPALRDATLSLGLAVVYFVAAKLGLTMAFVAEQVTPVWPPTGIALAGVLTLGYRVWPGISLGAFLANATANEPIATAAGIAIGNTLEALVGAWLLHQVVGFRTSLDRLRDVIGLVALAAGASTTISATIGTVSLAAGGHAAVASLRLDLVGVVARGCAGRPHHGADPADLGCVDAATVGASPRRGDRLGRIAGRRLRRSVRRPA
jgi:integral membrane sensor domain MASE1